MEALRHRLALNRFIVLGRVGMDLNADPPGARIEGARAFTTSLGGSAGNTAVALARQGAGAGMLSCVSDDAVGRWILGELAGYGVETRHLRLVGEGKRSSLALTETRAEDCQTVLYRNGAADFALTEADVAQVDFAGLAALVLSGTALAAEPSRRASQAAIAAARRAGAVVVLDIDWRAYSWASAEEAAELCRAAAIEADIVVGNDVEFDLLGGPGRGLAHAAKLAEGGRIAVFKRGPLGCTTLTPGDSFETPIFPVAALKPTGAGDGFMGGFLAGLAQGHPLEEAVRRGAATAAMIVAGIGCAPASPDRAALDRFFALH